jgi:glycosyltransferase involved in cell wall biosynthesis
MVLKYAIDMPIPEEVVVGNGVFLPFAGWGFDTEHEIRKITVSLNGIVHSIDHRHTFRRDVHSTFGNNCLTHPSLFSGFFGFVPFPKSLAGKSVEITLSFHYRNSKTSVSLGSVSCIEAVEVEKISPPIKVEPDQPLIAICMATYNPNLAAFQKQLDSIIAQTYRNWVLIINDDCSPIENYEAVCKLCENEPRIQIFRNTKNLNFYHNFERTLERITEAVDLIAFSDQDDYWYPDKLSRCMAEMQPGVSMVYSDMRIVKSDGEVLANTYWVNRRNYYDDVALLLLANTVTGASTLFRRSLLEVLLPFPYRLGSIYHDHWLSIVACAVGEIRYIDEPLYDYIQHGTNVLGHFDFCAPSLLGRLKRKVKATLRVFRTSRSSLNSRAGEDLDNAWTAYIYDLLRLELLSMNLRFRLADKSVVALSSLDVYRVHWTSIFRWFWLHIRVLATRRTTNHAEWMLLKVYLVVLVSRIFYWFREQLKLFKRSKPSIQS